VNIAKGEQFAPEFLRVSPNNRIPAIVDRAPVGGGEPVSVFESGAILRYLADKTGRLGGSTVRERAAVDEWLFWQVGGLGPMMGQAGHFRIYAPEKVPYAIDRYTREVARLLGVMDRRLADHEYLAGAYSIADIASWPWARLGASYDVDFAAFPNVSRWVDAIAARPAAQRALEVGKVERPVIDEEARKHLFGSGKKDA
jgi:GSH-dependent disulfide-bond oxidoreductase